MKLNILIVDDNSIMRNLIRSIISPYTDSISERTDGIDALSAFEENKPDLVFMDIEMGSLDGLSAAVEICSKYKDAKIMIVSSHDDKELRDRAQQSGAIHYLRKEDLFELPIVIKKYFPKIITLQFI